MRSAKGENNEKGTVKEIDREIEREKETEWGPEREIERDRIFGKSITQKCA